MTSKPLRALVSGDRVRLFKTDRSVRIPVSARNLNATATVVSIEDDPSAIFHSVVVVTDLGTVRGTPTSLITMEDL